MRLSDRLSMTPGVIAAEPDLEIRPAHAVIGLTTMMLDAD
jgi:hypothetical protein